MTVGRIAPVALYQEVAERLRQRIFSHELPPGTWVDEQALAGQHGFQPVTLGPRTLRADTAPLAALACIAALEGR